MTYTRDFPGDPDLGFQEQFIKQHRDEFEREKAERQEEMRIASFHRTLTERLGRRRESHEAMQDQLGFLQGCDLAKSIFESVENDASGITSIGRFAGGIAGTALLKELAPQILKLSKARLAQAEKELAEFQSANQAVLEKLKPL
jgi:hypothetical protein